MRRDSYDLFFNHDFHPETRTIYIGDVQGEDGPEINSETAKNVIKALHLLGDTAPITLYLNSFGGCWYSGMAIYDAVKACGAKVSAYVVGSAMSMASIILQACDERFMYPHATLMLHDSAESVVDANPQTFQNWADYSRKSVLSMYKIYAERSGKPASFWKRKCAADLVLTAPEALELGLIDAIYA